METLQRIVDQLDDERQKYRWSSKRKKGSKNACSRGAQLHLFAAFAQARKTDISRYKKEFFEIDNDTGFIFVFSFRKRGRKGNYDASLDDSLDNEGIYNLFQNNLKYRCKCIVGPVMLDRVVVYVAQSVDDLYQQRVQTISCIEDIMDLLVKKYDIEFKVGIGRIHRDDDILVSYQEAIKALNSDEDGRIVHIDDIAPDIYDVDGNLAPGTEARISLKRRCGEMPLILSIFSASTEFRNRTAYIG